MTTSDKREDANASLESELREIDRAWTEAYAARDIMALTDLFADDFIATDSSGEVLSKMDLIERIRLSSARFTRYEAGEFAVRSVFANGSGAIVTGRLTAEGEDNGEPCSFNQRFTRVYAKTDKGWKAVAAHVTLIK